MKYKVEIQANKVSEESGVRLYIFKNGGWVDCTRSLDFNIPGKSWRES